jgi:hypothetical protein
MGVLDDVVVAFGSARVAGESVALPQGGEFLASSGEQFVHVRLVADVEDDGVAG